MVKNEAILKALSFCYDVVITSRTSSAFLNTRKRAVNVATVARLALVGVDTRTTASRDEIITLGERRFWWQYQHNAVALY